MDFKSVFFNEFNRLRSGWRAAFFSLSVFLAIILILTPIVAVMLALPTGFSSTNLLGYVLQFSVSFATTLFFGWLFGKIFEDLPFRALGAWFTRNWFKDLVFGLIIGVISLVLAVLIAYLFGGLTFQFNESHGSSAILLTLGATLLIFIFGAAFEEVFFRGYLLQTLSRAKLFSVGLLITSVFFASIHNANPGANLFTWFNTFLAGIWLGIAYFKTRNLWLPFGVHLTWNWFQGSVFGINVSGLEHLATAPVMKATDAGPTWLTGGSYGIEGGLACTFALIISTLLIYFLPFLKPTEEMLAFSSKEQPKQLRAER
jgi:membrane protease YdiL (CAAX protease family)